MSLVLHGTDGVTFNDSSLQGAAASPYVLKNRIINGDMVISQRGTSFSSLGSQTYTLDRWVCDRFGGAATATVSQSSTAPTGFINSLLYTVGTGAATGATDYSNARQYIEGLNVADLGWGTASAKTVTLSFWVRSSVTGTYGVAFTNNGYDRNYIASYTISSANTWTQISVTIPGDTSGTWLTTNGTGIRVIFDLGVGSTYSGAAGSWGSTYAIFGLTGGVKLTVTSGATWYVTGVQLEVGTSATPFERRLYSQELANCQRYYWVIKGDGTGGSYPAIGSGLYQTATTARLYIKHPVAMRSSPISSFGGNITTMDITTQRNITAINGTYSCPDTTMMDVTVSGATGGRGTVMYTNTASTDFVAFSSEL